MVEELNLSAKQIYQALKDKKEVHFHLGKFETVEWSIQQNQFAKLLSHLHVLKSRDRTIHSDLGMIFMNFLIHSRIETNPNTHEQYIVIFSVNEEPERLTFKVAVIDSPNKKAA